MSQSMERVRLRATQGESCSNWLRARMRSVSTTGILMVFGMVSSVLYIASDVAASLRYEGYTYLHQAFSELLALGSPVRSLMMSYSLVYNVLVLAFAMGVWRLAEGKKVLRWTAVWLFVYGLSSLAGPYVPMHTRGTGTGLTDTLHIVDTFAMVIAIVAAMGFGAFAMGKRFKYYSIASIVTLISFGSWCGTFAPRMEAGLPTPWLGVIERMNIYPLMWWIAVLAFMLLRSGNDESTG